MKILIALQDFLRTSLPRVFGCKEYNEEKENLERIDNILIKSGLEVKFLQMSLMNWESKYNQVDGEKECVKKRKGEAARQSYLKQSSLALRCMILLLLTGNSFREMSKAIAKTPLYQGFCRIENLIYVKVPSKSLLQKFSYWLSEEQMREINVELGMILGNKEKALDVGLEKELDMSSVWVDSTCLEANIHFPVDWVLLKDAARSILKSIQVIRKHGLKHRMPDPVVLLARVNALAMGISAGRRNPQKKKQRNKMFRKLCEICKVIEEHGKTYRKELDEKWEETDLSRKQAEARLKRIDKIIEQLPEARRQAYERIIGKRPVASKDKKLSLYEEDVHVIVRGKAGARVEFGNTLFIAEGDEGFIVDYKLKRESSNGDGKLLISRMDEIITGCGGKLERITGDRGFATQEVGEVLKKAGVTNNLCPRSPADIKKRLEEDEVFKMDLTRRGQTEGRIGILKNKFLGGCPTWKGFKGREQAVSWAVLAHNLWVVARKKWKVEKTSAKKAG